MELPLTLDEAESLVATLPPDGHGLTILPFLSGERSPGWHDEASMAITGISSHTSSIDLLRAAFESLANQLSEVCNELTIALENQEIAPTLIGSGGAMLSSRIDETTHSMYMQAISRQQKLYLALLEE